MNLIRQRCYWKQCYKQTTSTCYGTRRRPEFQVKIWSTSVLLRGDAVRQILGTKCFTLLESWSCYRYQEGERGTNLHLLDLSPTDDAVSSYLLSNGDSNGDSNGNVLYNVLNTFCYNLYCTFDFSHVCIFDMYVSRYFVWYRSFVRINALSVHSFR